MTTAFAFATLLAQLTPTDLRATPAAQSGMALGEAAPPFSLVTLDGRHVTLETYRGKTLVINVWGSWCPPCREETADLNAEAAAGKRGGVEFLGVDSSEPVAAVRAYLAAKDITYPQAVIDAHAPFVSAYTITNYPTTLVIDAHGILRARHADNVLPRAQLHAYIAAAQEGRTAPLLSDQQRKLDAMLDPANFPFSGDAAAISATAHRAAKAIDDAEDALGDAMDDPARDHDLDKTHAEESALRAAVIRALAPVATTTADRAFIARLEGDQAATRNNWGVANAAYKLAAAFEPNDLDALGGEAAAASELRDYARLAELDEKIAALQPNTSNYVGLMRVRARLGQHAAAYAALAEAIRLAKTPQQVAWSHLYGGRSALVLHDVARAHAEFLAAGVAAKDMKADDPLRAMYFEEAQEGAVAAGLTSRKTSLALAPWTGPDLPGSVESTLKYRLAIAGTAGARVALRATGLPKGWIESFCSDRVCAPFRSTVTLPPVGVKIVEFQIVPGPGAPPNAARIDAMTRGAVVATVYAAAR